MLQTRGPRPTGRTIYNFEPSISRSGRLERSTSGQATSSGMPQTPFTRARPTCGTLPAAAGGIIIAAGTFAGREAAGLEGE